MGVTKRSAHSPPPPPVHKQHPEGPAPKMRENIPRPRNPWIIYRSIRLSKMRITDASGQKLKPQAGISKDLAYDWAHEPPEVRRYYIELAEIEKLEHKRKYPNYKFTPLSKEERAAEREAAKLLRVQRREAEKAQRKEVVKRRIGGKRGVRSPSHSSPSKSIPEPPTTPWVPDQMLAAVTLPPPPALPSGSSSISSTPGITLPFPPSSSFAPPDPTWLMQSEVTAGMTVDASATLGAEVNVASVNGQEDGNTAADASRAQSPLPTSFDEAAARMPSWTFPMKQGTTSYDPSQYLSLWPSIESGPFGGLWPNPPQGQSEESTSSGVSGLNPSSTAAVDAAAQGFSIENSVRIEMPIPRSFSSTQPSPLTNPFDFQSFTHTDGSADAAGSSSATQQDLLSQPSASIAVPSSEPFTFNLELNPSGIGEDGIINLAWGDYQEAYGGPDHAAQFFETLASASATDLNAMGYGVDSGDVSFAFDFNGPWNAPSASGSGAETYSFDDQRQVSGASVSGAVAGVGEVEGTQFLGNLPGSFGQSPLGTFDFQFGGERTVSDEARGRTISGPQQTSSSNPSPARSRDPSSSYQTSNRNYTGPIDKQVAQPSTPADEAHEGRGRSSSDSSRNYTGPIDLFAFQAHLQEERNFSGASSSAETYHTAYGGSDRNRPYTPPSGASNASRRVGGSWKPSKPQARNTSAATSSSGGARTTAQSLVDGNNIWEEFDFSSIPASSSSRTTSAVSSRQ